MPRINCVYKLINQCQEIWRIWDFKLIAVNQLFCHSSIDACRRHETPGWAYHICISSPSYMGVMQVGLCGCHTYSRFALQLRTHRTWIFKNGQKHTSPLFWNKTLHWRLRKSTLCSKGRYYIFQIYSLYTHLCKNSLGQKGS